MDRARPSFDVQVRSPTAGTAKLIEKITAETTRHVRVWLGDRLLESDYLVALGLFGSSGAPP